ncbi:MAG: alpha/beta hydrolase, partial [Blastocatellia bacterium]
ARGCSLPKLFVQGEFDQFGAPEKLSKFVDGLVDPKELIVVPGADHFFEGKLDKLGEAISDFLRATIPL